LIAEIKSRRVVLPGAAGDLISAIKSPARSRRSSPTGWTGADPRGLDRGDQVPGGRV